MFEKILICIFLGAVPVLFWSIPKTRRMTGSFMTALKTVPLGCLTMIFIPIVLYETIMVLEHFFGMPLRIGAFWRLGFAALGVTVGVLLIRALARWSWRKYRAEGKRSWIPFAVLLLGLAGGTFFFMIASVMMKFTRAPGDYRGAWQTVRLLDGDGTALAFEQASLHPFLAEYDYRLRFGKGGKAEYRKLRLNCGGRTYFNIYRLRDGRLFMRDKDSDYIVDPVKREVLFVFQHAGRKYAVPYPQHENPSIGWSSSDEKVTFRCNGEVIEPVPVTDELEGKIYYGCIENRFYPASRRPEQPVGEGMRP